jgi:hypothetical protein
MTVNPKMAFASTLPGNITSTREFAAGDTVGLYVEAYERVSGAAAHTVTLTAELRADGGTVVRKVSEDRSSSELRGQRGGYGFSAQLPLNDVAPGLYVLHVEARANIANRPVVSKDVQIQVR